MSLVDRLPSGCAVMGILNVTPDSFYDGGKYFNGKKALKRAAQMVEAGADIIDVGGQSTRPGSKPVDLDSEKERVIPVIEKLRKRYKDILISCDTEKPEVAKKALQKGADIINDVTGFKDEKMREIAAGFEAGICIMHMQGRPENMQDNPSYDNLLPDIKNFLHERARLCREAGIKKENIVIDPGIGFGKTLEDNLVILANTDYFSGKYPVLIGASRKSFLKDMFGLKKNERLPGSLAVAQYCASNGTKIVRVHDVKDTVETLKLTEELNKRKI